MFLDLTQPFDLAFITGTTVDEWMGYRHQQRRPEAQHDGLITVPIKFGRANRWPRHEIQAIVAARIAGASNDEIRKLVDELHALRASFWPKIRTETA